MQKGWTTICIRIDTYNLVKNRAKRDYRSIGNQLDFDINCMELSGN